MINNILNKIEFEKFILPIIKLDHIDKIKETIYKVFHFRKALPTDKLQYRICLETTGINSTYHDFEIEIRRLDDPENLYFGVIIQFRKVKSFIDIFRNPQKKIVNDLMKICNKEIQHASFEKFDPGGSVKDYVTEEFFYQSGAFNPNWKKQVKSSPLSLYTKEDSNSYIVEFLFTPNCYERVSKKTILRDNWLEIFSSYPSY